MPWRWVGWTVGGVLLVAAAATLVVGVDAHAGSGSAACGSGWDVISGRVGWPQWWSQDLADPVERGTGQLVRTVHCPGAVNRRILISAAVASLAIVVVSTAWFVDTVRTPSRTPSGRDKVGRVAALGTALTVLGGLLTLGGLVGIALITADPGAPLFDYVSRPVVVLAGLLLVLPAVLILALGRGLRVLAGVLTSDGTQADEPA